MNARTALTSLTISLVTAAVPATAATTTPSNKPEVWAYFPYQGDYTKSVETIWDQRTTPYKVAGVRVFLARPNFDEQGDALPTMEKVGLYYLPGVTKEEYIKLEESAATTRRILCIQDGRDPGLPRPFGACLNGF